MNAFNLSAALSTSWKDFKIFLKERGALLYLFAVPIVFILVFSGAAVGESDLEETITTLPVVNLDPDNSASQTLIDALNRTAGVHVQLYEQQQAQDQLQDQEIQRALIIPASYGTDIAAGNAVTLRLISHADANAETNRAVLSVVEGVAADLSLQTQLLRSFQQLADMQALDADEQPIFTTEMIVNQAQSQFERSRTEPLVGVEEAWPESLVNEREEVKAVDIAVPGFAILFIFLTAQQTAQSIYEEKKFGSFRRLLAAPISQSSILAGKMLPNFVTVLLQIVVIFGASLFLLPMFGAEQLSLGNNPVALIVVSFVIALCSTSMGVLIAGIARTEGQIGGVSQLALWGMGFIGIIFPQGLLPPALANIGRLIPHYWANQAYQDIFVRGQGLDGVMGSVLVLLGFTVLFFVVGLWRFDFD